MRGSSGACGRRRSPCSAAVISFIVFSGRLGSRNRLSIKYTCPHTSQSLFVPHVHLLAQITVFNSRLRSRNRLSIKYTCSHTPQSLLTSSACQGCVDLRCTLQTALPTKHRSQCLLVHKLHLFAQHTTSACPLSTPAHRYHSLCLQSLLVGAVSMWDAHCRLCLSIKCTCSHR